MFKKPFIRVTDRIECVGWYLYARLALFYGGVAPAGNSLWAQKRATYRSRTVPQWYRNDIATFSLRFRPFIATVSNARRYGIDNSR